MCLFCDTAREDRKRHDEIAAENARLHERVKELEFWWNTTERERDGYAAQSKVRGEALKELVGNINLVTTQGGNLYVLYVAHREKAEASLGQAHIAIAISPEQARKKEGK